MNRRTFLQSIPVAALLPSLLQQEKIIANTLLSDPNELICKNKFDFALSLKLTERPINEVVIEIAKSFLGVNYAANTIEAPGKEHLIINLQKLDCVTFYENSLVLARCIKKNTMTFEDYKKELQFVRYRDGIIDKYPSRLHYTSDYFFDNEKKSVLKNVTKEIGGVPYKKKINFMSTHADSYLQLRENPEFVKMIAAQEAEMNKRTMYHISKSNVKKAASQINDGDILGITTTIEGLDCTHTGIAIWQNKKLHMIHAPFPGSKVQITKTSLWEYLMKIKKDAGIMVARVLEQKV
ncbi:MAG: N-acetylmuramoyl-L-alanine amidase-like domain-containing protein [Bacteroidota bacterium]